MDTFYKENIGIETPQGDPLDYFQIEYIGFDNTEAKSGAQIRFYFREADALEMKIPNAGRTVFWPQVSDVIPTMQTELFSFDTIQTTAGETITLKDPTKL